MSRTLSYSQTLPIEKGVLMDQLASYQLAWFQSLSKKAEDLHEGMQVSRDFYTKINNQKVPGKSRLSVYNDHELTLSHLYNGGQIDSSWILEEANGATKVTYRETNSFEENRNEFNFSIVSLVYTFFFRRTCKKRINQLQEACQKGGQ